MIVTIDSVREMLAAITSEYIIINVSTSELCLKVLHLGSQISSFLKKSSLHVILSVSLASIEEKKAEDFVDTVEAMTKN